SSVSLLPVLLLPLLLSLPVLLLLVLLWVSVWLWVPVSSWLVPFSPSVSLLLSPLPSKSERRWPQLRIEVVVGLGDTEWQRHPGGAQGSPLFASSCSVFL